MSRVLKIPEPPADLQLDPVPRLRGQEAAAQWCREVLGIPAVTPRLVKSATVTRELESAVIGGAVHYSTLGLWRWLMGRVRPATTNR